MENVVVVVANLAIAVAAATIACIAWVRYSKKKWAFKVKTFREMHHGYFTVKNGKKKEILFIVNPASGGGKAMEIYDQCLEALEQTGHHVEVYVTKSSNDMISLSTSVDLSQYSHMIAILSGDSSIYEMVQATLRENNGCWPHAPILHLPGGSGNALSCEFHGFDEDIFQLVDNATTIRKGSVIKCTSPGATTRYSLHNSFDGVQRLMIDSLTLIRHTLYPAFGKPIIYAYLLFTLLKIPFCQDKYQTPFIMTILNSDKEGDGMDLGFGVSRFDDKLIILYEKQYKGLKHLFKFLGDEFSGKLGQDYKEKKMRPKGSVVDVRKSFVLEGDGHYKIYSDGSELLPIEGDTIEFEIVPNAVPYFVIEQKLK